MRLKLVFLPILIMFLCWTGTVLADTKTPNTTVEFTTVKQETVTTSTTNETPSSTSNETTSSTADTQVTPTTKEPAGSTNATETNNTVTPDTTTDSISTPIITPTPAVSAPIVNPAPLVTPKVPNNALDLPSFPSISSDDIPELIKIRSVSMEEFEALVLAKAVSIVTFFRNVSSPYMYIMLILGAMVLLFPGGGPMKRRVGWGMIGTVFLSYLVIWWGPLMLGVIKGMASVPN